jgi:hypothetical protein
MSLSNAHTGNPARNPDYTVGYYSIVLLSDDVRVVLCTMVTQSDVHLHDLLSPKMTDAFSWLSPKS